MAQRQRVLVVDGLSETEQVLKAVLEPRGMHVERVRRRCRHGKGVRNPLCEAPEGPFRQLVPDPFSTPPHVVVVDEDEYGEDEPLDERPTLSWERVPRIILRSNEFSDASGASAAEARQCYLQKPFHYSELVQAIERLLEQPGRAVAGSIC